MESPSPDVESRFPNPGILDQLSWGGAPLLLGVSLTMLTGTRSPVSVEFRWIRLALKKPLPLMEH